MKRVYWITLIGLMGLLLFCPSTYGDMVFYAPKKHYPDNVDQSVKEFIAKWEKLTEDDRRNIVRDWILFGTTTDELGPSNPQNEFPAMFGGEAIDIPVFAKGTTVVWVIYGEVWIAVIRRNSAQEVIWLVKPKSPNFLYGDMPPGFDELRLLALKLDETKYDLNDGRHYGARAKYGVNYWDLVSVCDTVLEADITGPLVKKSNAPDYSSFLCADMKYFHYYFLTESFNGSLYEDYNNNVMAAVHLFTDGFFNQTEENLKQYGRAILNPESVYGGG